MCQDEPGSGPLKIARDPMLGSLQFPLPNAGCERGLVHCPAASGLKLGSYPAYGVAACKFSTASNMAEEH